LEEIWRDVVDFQLINETDVVFWKLENNSTFSFKSVYIGLTRNVGLCHKRIWKGKIPVKIKIFVWTMTNEAILTKDNLLKRKWKGDPSCSFCENDENISHLFFQFLLRN